ncbi:MAG: hypothetical protein K2X93_13765 [Candidatus Obscuribacterales bacterium]|nr:hypothetical protein [Candidatus Obscuribacterales bacterium]
MSEKAEAKEGEMNQDAASDNQAQSDSGAADARAPKALDNSSEAQSQESEPVTAVESGKVTESKLANLDAQTAVDDAQAVDTAQIAPSAQSSEGIGKEESSNSTPQSPVSTAPSAQSASTVVSVRENVSEAVAPVSVSNQNGVGDAIATAAPQASSTPSGNVSIQEIASSIVPSSTQSQQEATGLSTQSASDATISVTSSAPLEIDLPNFPQAKHHIPAEAVPTEAAFKSENFGRDEVRHLLVPVKPFNRLVACSIVICCFSFLVHMLLTPGPRIRAQGLHILTLPEPGTYVFSFHGDISDPYGWTADGKYRRALVIDVEPLDKGQIVEKITPIKDMSGGTYFTVGEYQFNLPGKYQVTVQWEPVEDRVKGMIYIEKDPVERFFLKWILGIIGTISFFYMLGVPLSTRSAISTLEQPKPTMSRT